MVSDKVYAGCALCGIKACNEAPGIKNPPPFCHAVNNEEILEEIRKVYVTDREIHNLALESARTEARGYGEMTRVEEIMDFARHLGASRLGIAHCIGLQYEARLAYQIFLAGGFEVYTVCCKMGSIEKEEIGLLDAEKVSPGTFEPLCNPIGQAAVLAQLGTQLNVMVGLCVGHDSLFFAHSKAPVTVLVAEDRVLGHNPAAALCTSHSYYKRLKK